MKRWVATAAVCFFIFMVGAAPSSNQGAVIVNFTFPSIPPDFSHFTVYYGTQSSNYTATATSTSTTVNVTNLTRGQTYYFNVTQSNTGGAESDYTTEVAYTVPNKPAKATSLTVSGQ